MLGTNHHAQLPSAAPESLVTALNFPRLCPTTAKAREVKEGVQGPATEEGNSPFTQPVGLAHGAPFLPGPSHSDGLTLSRGIARFPQSQ